MIMITIMIFSPLHFPLYTSPIRFFYSSPHAQNHGLGTILFVDMVLLGTCTKPWAENHGFGHTVLFGCFLCNSEYVMEIHKI